MSDFAFEFRPEPIDSSTIASNTQSDLDGFSHYVEQEICGVQLFGTIVRKLSDERPAEIHLETDIASGKVGLEMAKITGRLPARMTDPRTPIVQDIYYPPVPLPDGNYALLDEVVLRRGGVETEPIARIPWLHILSESSLLDFQADEVDYVTDVALESYSQNNLDRTGRSDDGEGPFSNAHRVFFLHPLGQKASSELEAEKRALQLNQDKYIERLQMIAGVVLDLAQED